MRTGFAKIAIMLLLFYALSLGAAFAAERMAVKVDIANIRSAPSATAEQLWQVEKYHPLMVIEIKNNWCRFKDFEGDQGWVHLSLLDKTKTVIVKVPRCNVRTGPGTQHEIAFTVDKGIPFKVLQKKGDWLEVQHADGDRGWLFKTLVW